MEILAAEQTLTDSSWYQGTADAVRKNLIHFQSNPFDYMLVLSGDQLYRMDYRRILASHVETRSDITVATIPVPRKDVPGFGIMKIDSDRRITEFVEKPKDPAVQDAFRIPRELFPALGLEGDNELFLASMGIYVFDREAILTELHEDKRDFGRQVIPRALGNRRVSAYVFQGAWEDIGTIRNYFECSLDLTSDNPRFNMFDMTSPVFTRPRFLPYSKIAGGTVERSLISDGCIVDHATICESILGLRSVIKRGAELRRTVVMGSDFYETGEAIAREAGRGLPAMGIGAGTRIENAIIDKNARVGDQCVISPAGKNKEADHQLYYIRDGIVIIPKNAVIPHGTCI